MPEALNQDQIALLWQAAQTQLLSPEQRLSLSLANPYTQQGRVAEILQAEVARLDAAQARAWAQEAGASVSLAAAAAAQGLAPMTPALQQELARLQPISEEEAAKAEIERILAEGNPYAAPTRNITAALRLAEIMEPAALEKLKAEAPPAVIPGESAQMAAARAASVISRPTGRPQTNHPPLI